MKLFASILALLAYLLFILVWFALVDMAIEHLANKFAKTTDKLAKMRENWKNRRGQR